MAFGVQKIGCCAVLELTDISRRETPDVMVRDLLPGIRGLTGNFHSEKPFIMFTGVVQGKAATWAHADRTDDYGTALAEYIEANDLGTVDRNIAPGLNSTGNMVKIWLWRPNYDALSALFIREYPTTGATIQL